MIKDYRQLMLLSKRGLSIRQIARMAGCKWETARDALERMKAAYGSLEAIPQEATSDDIRHDPLYAGNAGRRISSGRLR